MKPVSRLPVILILLGVVLFTYGTINASLDAVQVGVYRGYEIYYDLGNHKYVVAGEPFSTQTYESVNDAKEAIDDYLGEGGGGPNGSIWGMVKVIGLILIAIGAVMMFIKPF
jgi:hypothetical protein